MNFLFKDKLFKIAKNEWFIGLLLLAAFLATNGYKYGWDDQHLEIPLLKSLIDPTLYRGDYYVESLKEDFTSYLYPVLARFITVEQIPITYFILFIISRFFLFFFIYKIWLILSQNKRLAFLCSLMIMLIGRVEEFLYRTFSHQEFALAIILAAIYLFYKERYLWAAAVLGLSANLHALYSFIPFMYLVAYVLVFHREKKLTLLLKSVALFVLFACPLFAWVIQKKINLVGLFDKYFYKDWIALYKIACPQNFIFYDNTLKEVFSNFKLFVERTREYWLLLVFFLTNIFFNQDFRKDKKSLAIIICGFGLLLLSFTFTYIFPSRFVLDLNLIRNTQFMLFLLMGYTVILVDKNIRSRPAWAMLLMAFMFPLIRFFRLKNETAILAGICMLTALGFQAQINKPKSAKRLFSLILLGGLLASCLGAIIYYFFSPSFNKLAQLIVLISYILIAINTVLFFCFKRHQALIKKIFIVIPFVVFFGNLIYYHHMHLKIEKTGGHFWQLQRNWEDMQHYVRTHVPKEAKLLVPYDMEMGGFRILSERKIVVSYRDCGIIGFNYEAAKEWQERIKDIEAFKVMVDGPITDAIVNAIFKYRVNYIIFMRYMSPAKNDILEPMYQNETFALYKILGNPP